MNVPTALASPRRCRADGRRGRRASTATRSYRPKPVFAVWVGAAMRARRCFEAAGIPHSRPNPTPCAASCISCAIAKRIDALMETPPSLPEDFTPDVAAARASRRDARSQSGRTWLDPVEVTRAVRGLRHSVAPATLARDADEAAAAAAPFLRDGGTVAVKILSPDIVHKSDVGGVRLNLTSEARGARRPSTRCWRARARRGRTRASPASPSIR